MSYNVTGTAGSDALDQSGGTGPGTIVGFAGFGGDTIASGSGADSDLRQRERRHSERRRSEPKSIADKEARLPKRAFPSQFTIKESISIPAKNQDENFFSSHCNAV